MSQKVRTIRLRRLEGQIGEVAYQITKIHFANFHESDLTWRPACNVFECSSCFRICVELAGVNFDQIRIEIAPGRLRLRGYRPAPEPEQGAEIAPNARKSVRVQTMEIDYGRFEREIEIPNKFDLNRISTEWANGLLWIFLPAKAHA